MKKVLMAITAIIMLLFVTVVFAFGETAIEYVNTIKSDKLLEKILADETLTEKAEVTESKVIQRLSNVKNGKDLREYLESEGYLIDAINATLKKYVDLNILYSLNDNENDYIISLSNAGYDYEKIVDIFRFVKTNGKSVSMIKEIYDAANGNFEEKFWIENAYANLTDGNTLTIADMYYYTNCGVSVDEVLNCYEISLHSGDNICNMLDARVEGKYWYDIVSDSLQLPDIQQEEIRSKVSISEIKNALFVSTITGKNVADIIEVSNGFVIKQDAFQALTDKYHLIDTVYEEINIVENDDESIIEAAKDNIPELDEAKIKELLSEGSRIKEIKETL